MRNELMLDNYKINYQVFFKNNKHMYLRMKPDGLKITCPKGVKQAHIESFIIKNKSWIIQYLKQDKVDLYHTEEAYLWGKLYPIKMVESKKPSIQFYDQTFFLSQFDKKLIERFYHDALKDEMNDILNEYHQTLSQYFDLNHLVFKTQLMKSRLGSCHIHKRVIKLNTILARVDKKYTRLVLFHELTHLAYPNHSKKFHQLLEKLYPNHRADNRKLSQIIRQFSMSDRPMKA